MPPEIVERSIVVQCGIDRAFQIFTDQLNRWWPKSHTRSGDPNTTVLIEPWPGGRLYERTSAGREHVWGQVILWEPPQRFSYDWYLGSSQEQPSRVDVHFTELGKDQTRVAVQHRGPELVGALWARNYAIYSASWEDVLPAYGTCCATG